MFRTWQEMPSVLRGVWPLGRAIQKYSSKTGGIDVARNFHYAHHRSRDEAQRHIGPDAEAYHSLGENRDERIELTVSVNWQHVL